MSNLKYLAQVIVKKKVRSSILIATGQFFFYKIIFSGNRFGQIA